MNQKSFAILKNAGKWAQVEMDADKITADNAVSYPIIKGVPCFLSDRANLDETFVSEQDKTTDTFSEKWLRFQNYGMKPDEQDFHQKWFCEKFGIEDSMNSLKEFYRDKKAILEVGTGSGFNCKFMAENCCGYVVGADISEGAFVTYQNTINIDNILIIQADLMQLPLRHNLFDFVIADGVLHHTPDTYEAVKELYKLVKPGGQFFFYIYKKMGAVKQFTDHHIREAFKGLSAEECFRQCEPITELGRELAKLNAKITLENPIPILGIPAGTHNVQRLIYYNFLKCFWNDSFDFETNNMINFDWYHPHDAHQHTEEEVRQWMREMGVIDYTIRDPNPNGLSVLLTKPEQK